MSARNSSMQDIRETSIQVVGLLEVLTDLQSRTGDDHFAGTRGVLAMATRLHQDIDDYVESLKETSEGALGGAPSPIPDDVSDPDASASESAIETLAEELTDISEGIYFLAKAAGDAQERMSGIRALSQLLDDLVAKLVRLASGGAS